MDWRCRKAAFCPQRPIFQRVGNFVQRYKSAPQGLGGALLDAEARIGELLKDLPSPAGSKIGKRGVEKTLPTGITHKLSHYCQQLAEHLALIEQVIAEAKENEDIPVEQGRKKPDTVSGEVPPGALPIHCRGFVLDAEAKLGELVKPLTEHHEATSGAGSSSLPKGISHKLSYQ